MSAQESAACMRDRIRPSIASIQTITTLVGPDSTLPSNLDKCADNCVTNVSSEYHAGDTAQDAESARVESQPPVHSVFSLHQKWFLVFMSAWGGFFSPLSGNIYLPALNVLANDLKVSNTLINLTLTSYMIFQGLAPVLIGDLSDAAGRRPAYVICFIIYIAANIGLALQRSYVALLLLRCLQSAGSSSTIALASGVVADIATSAERGTWMGFSTAGSLLGPALGPTLGGLLAQFLGWQAIFWFLSILAGVYLLIFVTIFPETGRNIVGDGSIPPPKLNWSILNFVQARKGQREQEKAANEQDATSITAAKHGEQATQTPAAERRLRWPNPMKVVRIVCQKDVSLLLFYNSLIFTAFYMVAGSAPSLFQTIYGFNELQVGLAFLPYGIGSCLATYCWGALIDWNFRRIARKYNLPYDRKRALDMSKFPLEKSRLEVIFPLVYLGAAVILVYGWALERNSPLAPVLVLQFLVGFLVSGSFNTLSVMVVDLYPDQPATATACNNLFRCLMGAGGTAVVIEMIKKMGRGWCFTFIALVLVCFSPMMWLIYFKGPEWREERRVRIERERIEKEAKRASKAAAFKNLAGMQTEKESNDRTREVKEVTK